MKKKILIILVFGILPIFSFGQKDTIGQGDRGNLDSALFNPKTVVGLNGTIVNVVKTSFDNRRHSGIHFMLQTADEIIEVHVGPDFYLEEQGVRFIVNDQVFVKGSRVEMSGGPIIIAMEITKEGKLIRLRTPEGKPMWAGRGRREGRGRMRN